jgi:hypothetical protein
MNRPTGWRRHRAISRLLRAENWEEPLSLRPYGVAGFGFDTETSPVISRPPEVY